LQLEQLEQQAPEVAAAVAPRDCVMLRSIPAIVLMPALRQSFRLGEHDQLGPSLRGVGPTHHILQFLELVH
jgi:hypothetical protein